MSLPVVTVTLLQYLPQARARAFANMGRFRMNPFQEDGLRFCKLLGSGIDYGLIPNWSTYAFLAVWENGMRAEAFRQTSTYQRLQQGTDAVSTLYLRPERSHGLWQGQNPFQSENQVAASNPPVNGPVVVLTRATIRPRALVDFWRHVPQARQRLHDHRDTLLFGIGVGEVPLIQQATLSVWRNADAVAQYAYKQNGHKEIVLLTRQRKWYSEELFARFSILNAEGRLFTEIQQVMSTI